jgi:hypothetical protein
MSTDCYEGINIPLQITEICNGDYKSDICVLHSQAIPDFNLLPNTSINIIIETFKTIILSQNQRLLSLENDVQILKNRLNTAGIP